VTKDLAVSSSLVVTALLAFGAVAQQPAAIPKVEKVTVDAPVTLVDNGDSWTLNNGIVKATILKSNGNMSSIVYKGINIIPGHSEFWEQTPSGTVTATVTIDPATNGGERAEVSVKGVNPGAAGVRGGGAVTVPGSNAARYGVPSGPARGGMDIEVRYTWERGTSGFYTYAEYSHPASYPSAGEGESRFILQMNPTFNWISVDQDRNQLMVTNADERGGVVVHAKEQRILSSGVYANSVEHKYSYNAVMDKLTAWGWSSTKDHIGVYFINPSNEYIGGGSEKLDLVAHMGATLLDYWTSGHYGGGAHNNIPTGENWKHVVGPVFVYLNAIENPKEPTQADLDQLTATSGSGMPAVPTVWRDNSLALWQDAVAKSKSVKAAWPYAWVNGVDYPHKDGRATVTGQLVLNDPQAASKKLPHLEVGLAHPDYQGDASQFQRRAGNGALVTWPHDGDYYQFWTTGADDGHFTIPNVRPGIYSLHAFADGVLGEYAKVNITVKAGKSINLGKLDWQPVRYGKQVWEIGYPDRTADKFFKGDNANYWLWGWPLRYALLFPKDVTYTIGKSNYHKDWFFEEVPHATNLSFVNPAAKDPANQRFGWVKAESLTQYPQTDQIGPWRVYGRGNATTWTVKFTMPKAATGTAVLRVALAGADGGGPNGSGLAIGVNGQGVGAIHPIATNALRYNTDKGMWNQYSQKFDGGLLKAGENVVTFTVPAGDVTTGVVWDYVRLELNDGKKAYPTLAESGRVN
jgi:rhamnogalacturonan endolyase